MAVRYCEKQVLEITLSPSAAWVGIPHLLGYIPHSIEVIQKTGDKPVLCGDDNGQPSTDEEVYLKYENAGVDADVVLYVERFNSVDSMPAHLLPSAPIVMYSDASGTSLNEYLDCTMISPGEEQSIKPFGMPIEVLSDGVGPNPDGLVDVGAVLAGSNVRISVYGGDVPYQGPEYKGYLDAAGWNNPGVPPADSNGWTILYFYNAPGVGNWSSGGTFELTLNRATPGPDSRTIYLPDLFLEEGDAAWIWVTDAGSTYPGLVTINPILEVPLRVAAGEGVPAIRTPFMNFGAVNPGLTVDTVMAFPVGYTSFIMGQQGLHADVVRDKQAFTIIGFTLDNKGVNNPTPQGGKQFKVIARARSCRCDGTGTYGKEFEWLHPVPVPGMVEEYGPSAEAPFGALVTCPDPAGVDWVGFAIQFVLPAGFFGLHDKMMEFQFARDGADEGILPDPVTDPVFSIGIGSFLWRQSPFKGEYPF